MGYRTDEKYKGNMEFRWKGEEKQTERGMGINGKGERSISVGHRSSHLQFEKQLTQGYPFYANFLCEPMLWGPSSQPNRSKS